MSGVIRGQVSGFQQRFEPTGRGTLSVWDFRLERVDDAGNPLPRIPVQMKGTSFDGAINNGDWIEVTGSWREGKTLPVRQLKNLDTGAVVRAKSRSTAAKIFGVVLALLVLAAFAAVVLFILSVASRF